MTDAGEGTDHPDAAADPDPEAFAEHGDRPAEPEEERWPIGFILTIVMAGLYLAYRLWQGLALLWRSVF